MSAYWFDSICILIVASIVLASLWRNSNIASSVIVLISTSSHWLFDTALQQIGMWETIQIDYFLLYALFLVVPLFLVGFCHTKTSAVIYALIFIELLISSGVWIGYVIFSSMLVYNYWELLLGCLMVAQILTLIIGVTNGGGNGRLLYRFRSTMPWLFTFGVSKVSQASFKNCPGADQ